jgi:hypothetical protein
LRPAMLRPQKPEALLLRRPFFTVIFCSFPVIENDVPC